jgi:transcription elongation factor GreA
MILTPPKRRFHKSQIPDEGPLPLTPQAFKHMEERLSRLKKSLPALIEEAQRTAAYGDRSDSAEYKEAKGILRRTHRQIFGLEDQLKRAVLIPAGKNDSGFVELGSTVVLEMMRNGKKEKKTFRILGSYETDPGKGRISNKSPLGTAIMGGKKGDRITIKTPNGVQDYLILEIR